MGSRQKATKGRNYPGNTGVPVLWWIGAIGVALFFLIFPYDRALFNGYEVDFEASIYGAAIYTFLLGLVAVLYLARNWKLESHVGVMSIVVLSIPLIYWLSSLQAVSSYYALFMTIVYAMFAVLFIVGMYSGQSKPTRLVIEGGIMIAGGIIVMFGLFNLFGQIYYHDALWLAHNGYRLTSVFQYPNTYAGFLIALFLAALYYATHSSNLYIRLANVAFLVPIWVSFMLTNSRGAIVVIPVLIMLILPFLRLSKQLSYLLYMIVTVGVSIPILPKLTTLMNEIIALVHPQAGRPTADTISLFHKLPLQGWGLLLLVTAITTALVWLYQAKLESKLETKLASVASRKWSVIAIPVILVAVGTVLLVLLVSSPAVRGLLPQQIADRFVNINFNQHSVLERLTFYKDGLKAAQDYPVLGAGGGAWQAMYEQYQNNPYESRQAHSFYVQVLVEIGWLGLAALLALIIYVYYLYIRSHIRHPELRGSHLVFYIISLSLLAHSAIDFDMSYIYIGALVFVSLGCMMAPYSEKLTIARLENKFSITWKKAIYPAVAGVLTLTILIVTITNNRAVGTYERTIDLAVEQKASFEQLMEGMDQSLAITPSQSAYSITKINWLFQSYEYDQNPQTLVDIQAVLDQAFKHDSYHRGLYQLQLKLHLINNEIEKIITVVEEALIKFPWQNDLYEYAMLAYGDRRSAALTSGDTAKAAEYEQKIIALRDEVIRRMDMLATLPAEQVQGRSFEITQKMHDVLATLK